MNQTSRLCARCKSPLPEGSGFCAGCGCDNGGIGEKLAKIESDIQKSKAKTQAKVARSKFLGILKWW